MPATSKAQYRFMEAASHDPKFSKKAGIASSKAAEFVRGQSPKGLPERKGK